MTKRVLYIISWVLLLALLAGGCRKKLADLYYDADQTVQPSMEKFFTEMLHNDRVRPSYWNIRTFVVLHTGIYTQSIGYLNATTAYQQNAGYTQDRWNDFYRPGTAAEGGNGGIMAHYRLIESLYESITDEQQKKELSHFYMAAKVVMFDQASQIVDLWGDIPFSEAGSVSNSGRLMEAKFDNAAAVYDAILDGLKNAALYFSSTQLSAAAHASFSKQDILLNGQFEKWQRYANSIRLRLLMRSSFVNEERARNEALTIINNPSLYPLIDGEANYLPAQTDVLLQPLTSYTDDLHLALSEVFNYSAPDLMLNTVMKPCDDPRIPVMFDKYGRTEGDQFIPNADYNGLPVSFNAEQQQVNLGRYAILDSATFLFNSKLPGIVITAAEVNFLKAEAWERWGGGDAQAAYEKAIRQSIAFYYYLNSLNTATRLPLAAPAAGVIDTFLQKDQIRYTGTVNEKLEKIWTQKWLHFGFLQSVESWAECRRTNYPVLQFYPSTLPGYELPPSRLVYPSSETSYNANYASVKEKDLRNARIFWDVN
ncbi:SusD/RagB family nutrient-binding outer membrane lipoprotein [Longitalea arenae]|uniref:SusD/RagB family nutrient-binding outer membrane lipoprotein n=1 Tax=Longitalea arenae TaxID=2812558 RepID=UPI001967F8C8|nr:SusD/RagB family nutrient-binding outer membrane lipoprotein [Longitalea arenae]